MGGITVLIIACSATALAFWGILSGLNWLLDKLEQLLGIGND